MSDNEVEGTVTAGAAITAAEGAEGDVVEGGDAGAEREPGDTEVMDETGRAHAVPRNPTKAVDEETSIGETPGRTSRIVGG